MREQAIERLKSLGIRPSEQRIVILEYFLGHRTHPTVETIYSELSPKMPTLSKTTVYNTLKLLEENNAILELNLTNTTRILTAMLILTHILCVKIAGKIIDVEQQENTFKDEHSEAGFVIQETEIYYRGLCAECINKSNNN